MITKITQVYRSIQDTVSALAAVVKAFFIRWFLPLHADDEPEPRESWSWDDSAGPSSLAPPEPDSAKEVATASESSYEDVGTDEEELPELTPAVEAASNEIYALPPEGDTGRVSRSAFPQSDEEKVTGRSGAGEAEESTPAEIAYDQEAALETSSQPSLDPMPVNPFAVENQGDSN